MVGELEPRDASRDFGPQITAADVPLVDVLRVRIGTVRSMMNEMTVAKDRQRYRDRCGEEPRADPIIPCAIPGDDGVVDELVGNEVESVLAAADEKDGDGKAQEIRPPCEDGDAGDDLQPHEPEVAH